MPNTAPNIFKYATGELSQDAMICWLVACARAPDGRLRTCGTDFIRTLWNHGRGPGADRSCAVSDVSEPERQYGPSKVDIYFEALVNGSPVRFAVEDKTDTEMHDGQLAGHAQAIGGEGDVQLIYFKTGYVFDDERRRANDLGFAVFSTDDMLEFLNGLPVQCDHELLRQYREWLTGLTDIRNACFRDWDFTRDFGQFRFMSMLMTRLLNDIGDWQDCLSEPARRAENDHSVGRGRNRGGAGPWTQYWFSRHLFWRIDAYQPLRLRVWTKTARDLDDWNADVWLDWMESFRVLLNEVQLPEEKFVRRMRGHGSLVNEGTVGAIDIGQALAANGGDMQSTLDKVAILHRTFIERIYAAPA